MNDGSDWITEPWPDSQVSYRIKSVICEQRTDFQSIRIVDSHAFGRMLLLDGIVQTTEKDEFIYHEMMVHVPMLCHRDPKKILIIGGGDGGILREVLKHDSVETAKLVEIDRQVIDLSREHMPDLCAGAFEDARAEVVISDGAQYLANTGEMFDVVIVDSSDPIGPAQVLFSEIFYESIHHRLNPEGIMAAQTGSIHLQASLQPHAHRLLKQIFRHAAFYTYTVPTYFGGLFSSIICSDTIDPIRFTVKDLQEKLEDKFIQTRYYSPDLHLAAFRLPPFFRNNLA